METLENGLDLLKKIRRLDGVAVVRGGAYAYKDLSLSDEEAEKFRVGVVDFFQAYANEGRLAKKVVIGFEGLTLMLINHRTIILAMFYEDQGQTEMVERSGELFLDRFSEVLDLPAKPKEETQTIVVPEPAQTGLSWPAFRLELESLLTKVVGSGQASAMIDRQLADSGFAKGQFPPSDEFGRFGLGVLKQIRDRGLRGLLNLELDYLLKQHH
tara:strand:+ start:617 stop:1255 length:639 start_codon:yes stop_codon:yes gene_type:complete